MKATRSSTLSRIFRAFTYYGSSGTVQNVTDLASKNPGEVIRAFADFFNVQVLKQGNRIVLVPNSSPLLGGEDGDDSPSSFLDFWMEQAFVHESQKEELREQFRQERYQHYEFMDLNSTETSLMLDTYSDEAVSAGFLDDEPIKITVEVDQGTNLNPREIEAWLVQQLRQNDILGAANNPGGTRATVRSLAKYGECFFKFIRRHENAPILIRRMDNPAEITIHRDLFDKSILGYKYLEQYEFFPWEFVHMSVPDDSFQPYGRSVLEPIRGAYQMLLINEALLSLSRASKVERLVIKVPVQEGNPVEAFRQLSTMRSLFKSFIFGSSQTAKGQSRVQALTDIIWFPGGQGYDLDKLQSNIDVAGIDDVEYFRDKFYMGTRLPKDYLLASQNTQLLGQSLAAQDIKFSRALLPLQWGYVEGVSRICTALIILKNLDPKRVRVKVEMKKPQALTAQMIEDAKGGFELVNTMVGSFKDATAIEKITPDQWLKITRKVCKLPPGLLEGLAAQQMETSPGDAPEEGKPKPFLDGAKAKDLISESVIHHDSSMVLNYWGITPEEIYKEQIRRTLLERDSGRRKGLQPLMKG